MRRAWILLLAAAGLAGCGETSADDAGGSVPADAGLSAPDAEVSPDAETYPDAEVFPDAAEPELGPVAVDITAARPPERLSAFNFLRFKDGKIENNEALFRYDLNTALYSDSALKERALWIPEGTSIEYRSSDAFELPVGSAVVKSFLFPADLRAPEENVRLIETRVLIKYADGWRAFPYLWREDGSDADYRPGGDVRPITFIDRDGVERTSQYLVPQRNQCRNCHELVDRTGTKYLTLIGLKARHIHREQQLEQLRDSGRLTGLPVDTSTITPAFDLRTLETTSTTALDDAALEKAARDYLDINCAHCHNPAAVQGVTSQLFLNYDNRDEFRLGLCKEPGSAGSGSGGLRFDIVPGRPDLSIMVYRTETETVGEMMPLLGRSLRDRLGTPLVRGWIERMEVEACE